jgi:hypothetical protein
MYSRSSIYDPVNGSGGRTRTRSKNKRPGPVTVKRHVPVKFGDTSVEVLATVEVVKRPARAELSREEARFLGSL